MWLSTCKASKFTLFCHRFLGCICYLFPAAGNKCPAFLLCSRRIASAFVKYPHIQQIAKAGGSVFWAATGVFKIYDAENGLILSSEVVSTNGQGHGALVGFLVQHQVNVVLCGGIGAGAQAALTQAGIQLFGGISGSADAAAADYLAGRLVFDPQRPLQSSCPRSRARLRLPFLPRGQRRLCRELPLTKRVKKCRVPREKSRCSTHLYLHF